MFENKKPIEQKEFCANPKCPHHYLDMKEDLHYHETEDPVIAISTGGVLYTHPIKTSKIYRDYGFPKVIYLCDICKMAISIYKGATASI